MAAAATGMACAARTPGGWASRFIVPGTPSVDPTLPSTAGAASMAGPPPAAPAAPIAVLRAPAAATLEATSPLLRERLSALALAPSPRTYLEAAAAYRHYFIHDRAFDLIRQGLQAFPHDGALHAAAAAAWRDWGLPDRGLRDAHLAVRYAPESAPAHTTLGTVLWALGAGRAALQAFERAATLAPDAAYARHNRCIAARALRVTPAADCGAAAPGPEPW